MEVGELSQDDRFTFFTFSRGRVQMLFPCRKHQAELSYCLSAELGDMTSPDWLDGQTVMTSSPACRAV